MSNRGQLSVLSECTSAASFWKPVPSCCLWRTPLGFRPLWLLLFCLAGCSPLSLTVMEFPGLMPGPSYLHPAHPSPGWDPLYLMTPTRVSSPTLFSELRNYLHKPVAVPEHPQLQSFIPAPPKACFPPRVLLSKWDPQPARDLNHKPGSHLDSSLYKVSHQEHLPHLLSKYILHLFMFLHLHSRGL